MSNIKTLVFCQFCLNYILRFVFDCQSTSRSKAVCPWDLLRGKASCISKKKKESLSLPQEFTGQMKCKLWLIKNYEHKVDTTTSLESTLCSASKETFGRKPLLPNILGKLIKQVWNEENKVVKRGPTNKQEKMKSQILSMFWTSISE